jgi:curved DNA-binding protein CbpA
MAEDGPDRDLYQVLGVEPTASATEITTAYRRLVRSLHPDSRPDQGVSDGAPLAEVLAAYDTLRDPNRRATYDARRRHHPSYRPPAGAVAIPVRHVDPGSRPAETMLRVGPVRLHSAPLLDLRPVRRPARAAPADLIEAIEALFRGWW